MTEPIKSFESAEGGSVGDLLSSCKALTPVKVGLMLCGYFEYWRMYPETLKAAVERDLAQVEARMRKAYPSLVCPPIVDTLDAAESAGRAFRDAGIDVLVVAYGCYTPDFISLHAINHVRAIPLVLFSTQCADRLDPSGNYEHSLRNSGLIGMSQLTGTLRKMRRDFRVVAGSVSDERAYRRIADTLKAVQAVADIREANIGVIGHVFRGMYDLELSKTRFKGAFDANIIYLQPSHLLDIWADVEPGEVKTQTDALLGRFPMKNVTREDVERAMRLAIAMRGLAERFKLDAMCFLDQHYVQKHVRTTARIGASLLMEQTRLTATCEGDLGGLIMMMLMRSIGGMPALMGEWGEYDLARNACLIMGHGIGVPALAASEDQVLLARTPEEWGFTGSGLNYELIMKPGPATVGHFIEMPDGYKMLLSKVESLDHPRLDYDELHALVKVGPPVRDYLETLMHSGVSHHCILAPGDMTGALSEAARLLGCELFIPEEVIRC